MTGNFTLSVLRRRRKENAIKKKTALKKSLRHQLPEVFVKAILKTPSLVDERIAGNSIIVSPISIAQSENSNGTMNENLCKKCKKQVTKEMDTPSQYDVQLDNLSDDTVLVAHQLKTIKEQRRKFQDQEELNEVLDRVQAALRHSGIEFTDEIIKIPTQHELDMFSIEGNKRKKKERSYISDMFKESEKLSLGRDEVMQDVENWFTISNDDLTSFCSLASDITPECLTDEYFIRVHKAFRRSNDSINRLCSLLQKSMLSAGYKLHKEPTSSRLKSQKSKLSVPQTPDTDQDGSDKFDPEAKSSQDSVTEHKIKINKKIFTDNELNSLKNMQQALKIVSTLLNDGTRHAISSQAKSCYKIGLKQFKIASGVIERKFEHAAEQEEKVKQLSAEVTNLKFIQQQRQNDIVQLRQMNEENQQLRDENSYLQQCLQKVENTQNEVQYEAAKRSTSRHVSIKLPEETVESVEGNTNDPSEIDIVIDEAESNLSITSMRDNLKKKLSSRKTLPASNSLFLDGNNTPLPGKGSSQKILPTPNSSLTQAKASSISTATITRISRQEIDEYDTESVSSHEQIDPLVNKSDHQATDQLRQQIHVLREELRISDDRYYEQREELERLREIVASQSTSKPERNISKEQKYEKQIEKLEVQQRHMKKEISEKTQELLTKQKLVDQLRHQVEVLMKEREKLMNEENDDKVMEEPKLDVPRLDLSEMPRNQLIAKIKRQSEKELQRLRNFIVREQQRFQANLRRHNLEADKTVTKLRHDISQIVRAIGHFKANIEKLYQQDIDSDESLVNEASSTFTVDGKSYSEDPIDTLVIIERRLNILLVQRRLTLKHTNANRVSTEKELEQYRVQLQKHTEENADQQRIIRKADVRNDNLSRQCQQLLYKNQCLQKEMEPCKELLKKYTSIQEELERTKVTEKENDKDSKKLTKELELDRNRLKKELNQLTLAQICQKNAPTNSWNHMNCGEKKKMIDKAFSMSQISPMYHEAGTDILTYCNELAIEKFSQLVRRYMEQRRFRYIRETLPSLAAQYKDEKRFNAYILRSQERNEKQQKQWDSTLTEIRGERERAFLLLREVFGKSDDRQGFLVPTKQLSRPTYAKPPKHGDNKSTNTIKQMPIHNTGRGRVSDICGYGIYDQNKNKPSFWQIPPTVPENLVQITTPKILDIDIKQSRQYNLNKQKHSKIYLPPIATLFPEM